MHGVSRAGLTCRSAPAACAALLLASVTAGCGDDVACGRDTALVDGRCVPVAECLVTCQAGTVLDETTLGCVPEFLPRVCDPDTTVEEQDPDGIFVCRGASGSPCGLPLECPEPSSLSRAVVCGQIIDVESGRPEIGDDRGTACAPGAPASGGPCSLQLRLFDATELASVPADAAPLDASVTVDGCGRFAAELTPPPASEVAVELDDGDEFDDRARTVTSLSSVAAGARTSGVRVFTVRVDTDERWTAASERATRFEESGATLAILRSSDGAPAVGVSQPGALFFDEPGERAARLDPSLDETGPNGAALSADTPAAPTRNGQACLAEPLPFAPGLLWVVEAVVTCDEGL